MKQSIGLHYQDLLHTIFDKKSFISPRSLLQRAAVTTPTAVALIADHLSITYQTLYQKSLNITHFLMQNYALTSNDTIGLLCDNSIEYYALYFGIWQTGAVIVPLNTFLSEREMLHIIQDSHVRCIITSTAWFNKITDSLRTETIIIDGQSLLSPEHTLEKDWIIPTEDQEALAVLLYTSGTTGVPKGVMLSSKAIMTNVAQVVSYVTLIGSNERIFAVLPLFHSFAQNTCIWTSFFARTTVIVVSQINRKHILEGLQHKPTIIIGVPSLYGLFCLMKNVPLDSVRYFISGGDALPTKIKMAFELIYQRKLCNGYGLTEASPFIAAHIRDTRESDNSVGMPAPGIATKCVDENGNTIEPHGIGILHIKGNNLMMGYYKSPHATDAVLIDGWLNTGDLATFDHNHNLVIVGRQKDVIIHKGFNIYPLEIENILMSHAAIMQASVIGIPDESGQLPVAFVTTKKPTPENLIAILKALCKKELASYKIPRYIFILDALPLNSMNKVNKGELKKLYEAHYSKPQST